MPNKAISDGHTENNWKRMSFKGNKVWVETDQKGELVENENKVRIKYNLKQEYEYWVHPKNLSPEAMAVPAKKKGAPGKKASQKTAPASVVQEKLPDNCIQIYTDGAASGNPGPSGIGVYFIYGSKTKKISRYIGHATNNIAELTAIKEALSELKRSDLPVRIFTDSSSAIGSLTKGWKPKKNQALVEEIKDLMESFSDLGLIKVKGHAGVKENEVADYLATSAIKKGLQ